MQERIDFEKYDKETGVRTKLVEALKKEFADYGLTYVPTLHIHSLL